MSSLFQTFFNSDHYSLIPNRTGSSFLPNSGDDHSYEWNSCFLYIFTFMAKSQIGIVTQKFNRSK